MPIYDYVCTICHKCSEFMHSVNELYIVCDNCGEQSLKRLISIPNLIGDSTKSFNAHYDLQLGKHFESAEQKKKFLKDSGRAQVSGPLSPRKSNKSNYLCSKSQAIKGEGWKSVNHKTGDKHVGRSSSNTR